MLKNQHESWVNYYFQPYLSSQLIFIEVILASMKGLRQWPLSLCWGSGSGIYFLLSSFLLLLVPGQSSLFMDFCVFVQVDGFATVENSLHASLFAVFYSCNVLLTHCSMSLLSAEPCDHRKTKHSREGRRRWSTVCLHDRNSVYAGIDPIPIPAMVSVLSIFRSLYPPLPWWQTAVPLKGHLCRKWIAVMWRLYRVQ